MSRKRTEIALKQELARLTPVSLWREDDGSYHLFGVYSIAYRDEQYYVTKGEIDRGVFSSKRAAAVWCIADYSNDFALSQTVRTIDSHLVKLSDDLSVRKNIRGPKEFISLVHTKTEPKQRRIQELKLELDRCVRLAKHYQRGIK